MATNTDIKKILDKIEPLLVKLDEITGKDNLLVNSENIRRIEARIKTDTAKQISAVLKEVEAECLTYIPRKLKNKRETEISSQAYEHGVKTAIESIKEKLSKRMD